MKLPIILSAMIAALAIPESFASEATGEPKTEATAPEAEKVAPKAKGKKGKASGEHHAAKGGKHHKNAHSEGDSGNSPQGDYKGEYGEKLRAADGDVNKDLSPKAGVMEVPGQKTQ